MKTVLTQSILKVIQIHLIGPNANTHKSLSASDVLHDFLFFPVAGNLILKLCFFTLKI